MGLNQPYNASYNERHLKRTGLTIVLNVSVVNIFVGKANC